MSQVGGNRDPEPLLPVDRYVLALVWFDRRVSQGSGNPYLRGRFVVCGGPMRGRGFFCPVNLDVSNPGCRRRWEVWLEAIGHQQAVELDSDAEIAAVFKGAPFVATVKVSDRGAYQTNDLDKIIFPRFYTATDRQIMEAWRNDWNGRTWMGRDPSDPGPSDGDGPPVSEAQPQWSPGSRFADDDDDDALPF